MISPALPPNPQACWGGPQAQAQAQSESKLSTVRQSSEHRAQTWPGFLPPTGATTEPRCGSTRAPSLARDANVASVAGNWLDGLPHSHKVGAKHVRYHTRRPVPHACACKRLSGPWPSVAVLSRVYESTGSLQRNSSLVSVFWGLG